MAPTLSNAYEVRCQHLLSSLNSDSRLNKGNELVLKFHRSDRMVEQFFTSVFTEQFVSYRVISSCLLADFGILLCRTNEAFVASGESSLNDSCYFAADENEIPRSNGDDATEIL